MSACRAQHPVYMAGAWLGGNEKSTGGAEWKSGSMMLCRRVEPSEGRYRANPGSLVGDSLRIRMHTFPMGLAVPCSWFLQPSYRIIAMGQQAVVEMK